MTDCIPSRYCRCKVRPACRGLSCPSHSPREEAWASRSCFPGLAKICVGAVVRLGGSTSSLEYHSTICQTLRRRRGRERPNNLIPPSPASHTISLPLAFSSERFRPLANTSWGYEALKKTNTTPSRNHQGPQPIQSSSTTSMRQLLNPAPLCVFCGRSSRG